MVGRCGACEQNDDGPMLAKPPMAQQQDADAGPMLSCRDGPVMVGRCRACEQNDDGPMLANQQWPYSKIPTLAQCCHKASAQYWWAGAGPVSKTALDQCWATDSGPVQHDYIGPALARCRRSIWVRLHASMDDFAATVQKARRFASTTENPRPRKSVRIATPPPSHDSIQVIEGQASLHDKVDKLESLIRSIAQPRVRSPSPGGPSVGYLKSGGQSQKSLPVSRPKDNGPQNNNDNCGPPTSQRTDSNKQFVRPFENRQSRPLAPRQWQRGRSNSADSGRETTRQNDQRYEPPTARNTKPKPKRRCWICGHPHCHSDLHNDNRSRTPTGRPREGNDSRPWTPPPRRRWDDNRPRTPPPNQGWQGNSQRPNPGPTRWDDTCWTCGRVGCRTWFHEEGEQPTAPPVPSLTSQECQENVSGTRPTGNRGPSQPARPNSH